MNQENPELEPENAKFQTYQFVKIRNRIEGTDLGSPIPMEDAMGKSGVVEMEGKVFVRGDEERSFPIQAYFVRVDGIGPVLAGEGWIEDAGSTQPLTDAPPTH